MNILINIHAYVPHWNSGAEMAMHQLAQRLIAQGHSVTVVLPLMRSYKYEGVQVHNESNQKTLEAWKNADVVFTQLQCTGRTINLAKHFDKKVVHFAVNDNSFDMIRYKDPRRNFVVYNSEWVKKSLSYPLKSFVLPPLVDYRHYDVGGDPFDRKYITLINHIENKGVNEAIEIAKLMPERQFLFVAGGYGEQVKADLSNITYFPNTEDIREVYKQTRLLLMPSKYESWGRTCTEAMCNGIPVLHEPTKGLLENTDGCQVMLDRENIPAWVGMINELDNKRIYNLYSEAGRLRAKQLDPDLLIADFENWLSGIVLKNKMIAA